MKKKEEMLESKVNLESSKPEKGKIPFKRLKRVPISIRNVLKLTPEQQNKAYNYRWVNQNEDRVPRFQEAGWSIVLDKEHAGGYRATGDPSKIASYVEKSVGSGTKAVLMRIENKYYEEDQRTKQKEVDEIERSMDPRYRATGSTNQSESGWTGKIDINRQS